MPSRILISPTEWRELEAGLIQRARLLNWILSDLYGAQKLLRGGHTSARASCSRIRDSGGRATACRCRITRSFICSPSIWRVPPTASGGCFRTARRPLPARATRSKTASFMAETFPDLFREFQVQRLASFFRAFRNNMLRLSTSMRSNPRVVLLTPGPLNETYFEHSYLARYLGFTLAQGGDLTVRDSRVFLKTLEGLKQVDVILRRVDGDFCDPIELRSDSFLGVAGLVEAVRAGNVVVANALGSGADRNARV